MKPVLDDLKYIHQRDGQDALGIAEKQWQQYTHNFEINWQAGGEPLHDVVVAGMGGSALAAAAMAGMPGLKSSLKVVRDYDLPDYANETYLLICSSYSGNTEETLSVFNQAIARPDTSRPKIVCLSSGGQLAELAQTNNLTLVSLPTGYQPRFTFGLQLAALAQILKTAGVLDSLSPQLTSASQTVQKAVADWRPDVASKDNYAKRLVVEIAGKSPVIYSGSKMAAAGYKWKISFNETAKNVAWCNQYPEFNHNEFIGWSSHPPNKPYSIIELRSQHEHPRILKRFKLSGKLLSGRWPSPLVVDIPKGNSAIEDLAWAIALGDFVSIYLALVNGVNPTPVDLVEKLKTELNN